MVIEWERGKGEGNLQEGPNPSRAASTSLGSDRLVNVREKDTTSGERIKPKVEPILSYHHLTPSEIQSLKADKQRIHKKLKHAENEDLGNLKTPIKNKKRGTIAGQIC
ncbi:MAG: hypothetical protein U9R20_02445 [Thermodesulfobacteriota bacterium]|nr:hypothetical protein [Thermodesulfobacteriota bacterium]